MLKIWMTGLLLLAQPAGHSDSLTITQQGKKVAVVNREDFTMPLPGTPLIDDKKYAEFVDRLERKVHKDPVNAVINDQEGSFPARLATAFPGRG